MAVPLRLEEFDCPADHAESGEGMSVASERERLDVYEEGYRAGWDDAVNSRDSDEARISAEVLNALQQMSFTFHEARASVLKSLRPLLEEMVDKVIPHLARENLVPMVVDQVTAIARDHDNVTIGIHTAPANHAAIERLLAEHDSLPARLVTDPELGDGEARIQFGHEERHVNLDAVVSKIQASTNDFFELNKKVSG